MVSVKLPHCTMVLDGFLKSYLDFFKQLPENDWDVVGLCGGYEGSGKTTLFMQVAYYFDHDFCMDKIVFNIDQFNKVVDEAEPGSCILYDEADDAAVGANWAKDKVKSITSKMKRIRKKRLFILFVTPTFFDLGKYFAIHRARFFIHVYSKGLTRGYWRLYDREDKKMLYFKGKQFWDMNATKSTKHGSFTKLPDGFPIDMNEYESKKDEATEDIGRVEVDKEAVYKEKLLFRLLKQEKLTMEERAELYGVTTRHFRVVRAKIQGNEWEEGVGDVLLNDTPPGGGSS